MEDGEIFLFQSEHVKLKRSFFPCSDHTVKVTFSVLPEVSDKAEHVFNPDKTLMDLLTDPWKQ